MYLNSQQLDLSVALWLATDTYAHRDDAISVTGLLKPTKQIVLAARVPEENQTNDVITQVASSLGTAVHDSIEASWVTHYAASLAAMGYPKEVIDAVAVNPTKEQLDADTEGELIPVYTERRVDKEFMGHTVTGEYDFCAEGRVEDFKCTSTFTYIKGVKEEDYRMQGSLYRWLDPDVITQDVMAIQFIFTDWKKAMAASDPKYPPTPVLAHRIQLLSLEETEEWVKNKLADVERCMDLPEDQLPRCTQKDLWQDDSTYKYYADPEKAALGGRSTKNFSNSLDANNWLADKGKGVVVEVIGKVRACGYCAGFYACKQKDEYSAAGILV